MSSTLNNPKVTIELPATRVAWGIVIQSLGWSFDKQSSPAYNVIGPRGRLIALNDSTATGPLRLTFSDYSDAARFLAAASLADAQA